MSFASDAREELIGLSAEQDAATALAEASGMIAAGGLLSLSGGGGRALSLESEQQPVARHACDLFARVFSAQPELRILEREASIAQISYRVTLHGAEAERAMQAAGLDASALESRLPGGLLDSRRRRRAYLRGAFLAAGTLGAPEKGYHLEWRLDSAACAEGLRAILAREGVAASIVERRDKHVLYLKDAERICDALAAMGAVSAMLALHNVMLVKSIRNSSNRRANCDNANLGKVADASARQAQAIEYLEKEGIFPTLSAALRLTAELRMEHREASIEELGAMFTPPIGKSAVNHRLRRLQAIAEQHRERQKEREATT